MFSSNWAQRKKSYDFVVIGSGYGGAITAARIAAANLNPKPSVCILERGMERWPGTVRFPDELDAVMEEFRSPANPMGIYEMLNYRDISVIKGCGLGGTSLINANVAATPEPDVFEQAGWPRTLNWERLRPCYDRARKALGAGPDPRAWTFPKVQAMDRRARELGLRAVPLDLAVNFTESGANEHGIQRRPCLGCGDCTTGCNHLSKNTLYMNYLPMARNAGAAIFTQSKVDWIERLSGGGWRVHGSHDGDDGDAGSFTLDAANVILGAGSINSTEILLRSQTRGLSLSPAVGTRFSCNGDFFGLAYNGDYRTQVTGFGNHIDSAAAQYPPGPAIVSAIHYDGKLPLADRFQIEDLTIPRAYIAAARRAFPLLQREDSDTGDEAEERRRIQRDIDLGVEYDPDGALNHTMFYLVMGFDDTRGRMVFETSWHDRDGQLRVVWDDAGRQRIYTRLDEELRRHARALGASYIANPLWSFLDIRHLMTAHPIGGCPIGEDYQHGAVDQFGRVFTGDGGVHQGLFLADGALIPCSIGVNPFLTISALAEQIAERKIRELQGEAYPQPAPPVSVPLLDPADVVAMEEAELDRLFLKRPAAEIGKIVNSGRRKIDLNAGVIENDTCWKGFFPKDHVLNAMSAALFTGFRKEFRVEDGRYLGITSDSDGRIRARNSIEEVTVGRGDEGLDPGRYLLLRYLDPPWQGFYDLLKVIQDDLIVGRVCLGEYPHGARMFTFVMTRTYRLTGMTAADHRELFAGGAVPSREDLAGTWRMDAISSANQLQALAFLEFDPKPDGRLESRYQLAGLMEGLLTPRFLRDHFELHDFTPFHDEIRKLDGGTLVGKYVAQLPEAFSPLGPVGSLGLLHFEPERRFGFYYVLTRAAQRTLPRNTLLRPFLDAHLPDGLGMTFDEEMAGWYAPGETEPAADRPAGAVDCSFRLRMSVRDLNEFIEGPAHEARARGTIKFGDFDGRGPVAYSLEEKTTWFQYLTVNPATGEAEMRYYLQFTTDTGNRYALDGRKYMQKDRPAGPDAAREVIDDYTTLYAKVYELTGSGQRQAGAAYLKFRTFEDLAAAGNLLDFVASFQVTGTDDPLLRSQGLLRFLGFTANFVAREYDPLAAGTA
ncbi:MAG: GMC family oxidoreductase [Acidobacteria bacterium]|nr:GMC family oxidoreductase [Acidobacteriota bacterium]